MSSPFIIDETVRQQAKEVVAYARAHRQNINDMMRAMRHEEAGVLVPLGHDRRRQIYIQVGFVAVYSIEQHPGGWFHHISMSSKNKGKLPRPESINLLLEAMGLPFTVPKDCVKAWEEDITGDGSGGHKAINVLFHFKE